MILIHKKFSEQYCFQLKIFTLGIFMLTSCNTMRISEQNVQYLYQTGLKNFTPEIVFYHINDSITKAFYSIPNKWCLYSINENSEKFHTNISLKLTIFESYEAKQVLDSLRININDSLSYSNGNSINGFTYFKLQKGRNYLIQATFIDLNKQIPYITFHEVDKTMEYGQHHFYICDKYNVIKYNAHLNYKDTVIINNSDSLLKKVYVFCYFNSFPIATPPFSIENQEQLSFKPDSIYTVLFNNGMSSTLNFKKNGLYHFLSDTNKRNGFSIFCFNDDFPSVTTPSQMLGPIRYISSQKEFNILVLSADKKNEIDAFWIDIAGNKERAKELIKKYYSRVEEANCLFTSYLEGWKTDRGMLYIVLGPPNIVYRNSSGESWIYGESNYYKSYTFNFVKTKNPFTDNDYSLIRSPIYKDLWYISVENWRR